MRRYAWVWAVLAIAPAACRAQSDWVSLFDGKTMNGWEDPRKMTPPGDAWTIDAGCLKANHGAHITEDLFSKDVFRDFELSFEWKIAPGANSGLKYRIQDKVFLVPYPGHKFEDQVNYSIAHKPENSATLTNAAGDTVAHVAKRPNHGQEYVVGFEYQLLDNGQNEDAKAGNTHQAGALYDIAGPSKDATKPVGEFNESRLIVKGNHVEHWLNGVKVVEADLDSTLATDRVAGRWGRGTPVTNALTKQPRKECPISLQNHGGDAWFRNIKIRRLE